MRRKMFMFFLLTILPLVAIAQETVVEETISQKENVQKVKAQKKNKDTLFDRGVFNHLGFYAGPSTEGISFGIATCITPYIELSAGMNIMPGIKIKTDENEIDIEFPQNASQEDWQSYPSYTEVAMDLNLSRTSFDVKASIYPFGGNSTFCFVTGLSFGGEKLVKLEAHSDAIASMMQKVPQAKAELGFEDHSFFFDRQGDIKGDIRGKSVSPYLGIGVGRNVGQKSVGFRFDLGCYFTGKVKFYQNDRELSKNIYYDEEEDKPIYEKIPIYPVMRFCITGKIL